MTEPYTAEELPEAVEQLLDFAAVHEEVEGEGLYNANDLPDLARLAATLREYERVVTEVRDIKDCYERILMEACTAHDPSGSDKRVHCTCVPHLRDAVRNLSAEVAALRAGQDRWEWAKVNLAGLDLGPGGITAATRARDGKEFVDTSPEKAIDAARAAGEG